MLLSDLLNLTVAQVFVWLTTVGIAAGVAYALGWFPNLDPFVRNVIATVLTAALVAAVTALASFIPDTFMQLKVIDAAFALVAALAAIVGGWKFGSLKASVHFIEAHEARGRVRMLAAGKG
jgi:hypothetical protein